jgi:hypothetical protein
MGYLPSKPPFITKNKVASGLFGRAIKNSVNMLLDPTHLKVVPLVR